jgi:hypothetical protein
VIPVAYERYSSLLSFATFGLPYLEILADEHRLLRKTACAETRKTNPNYLIISPYYKDPNHAQAL